jgi:hypothetical protein
MTNAMPSSTQPVAVEGSISGLNKGNYSAAVHEYGDLQDNGARTGQPFSPKGSAVGFLGHLEAMDDDATVAVRIAKYSITHISPIFLMGIPLFLCFHCICVLSASGLTRLCYVSDLPILEK